MLLASFFIPIAAILAVFVYLTVQSLAQAICEASKHRADAELKIALAQRGMTAEEIERVVSAKPHAVDDEAPYAHDRRTPSTAIPPHKPAASAS